MNNLLKYSVENIFHLMQRQEYDPRTSIVINKSSEPYGGLLNMAGGFPLEVNGVEFRTLEHLYQCLRLPQLPRIQKYINEKPSPLVAKWSSKQYRSRGRKDWFLVKIGAMRWALKVKMAQHYDDFGELLNSTGSKVIVETSPDGDLWGGTPKKRNGKPLMLVGQNIFGKLLMELRDEYRTESRSNMIVVHPLDIPDFKLFGKEIRRVNGK